MPSDGRREAASWNGGTSPSGAAKERHGAREDRTVQTKASVLILSAAGLLLAAGACTRCTTAGRVDGRQDVRNIHMYVGDQIIVHLGYGPNTSHAWNLDPADLTLFDASDPVLIPNAAASATGTSPGGVEAWAFEARAPGPAASHWEYRRGGIAEPGPAAQSPTITVPVPAG
jgi:predicted secreted protein